MGYFGLSVFIESTDLRIFITQSHPHGLVGYFRRSETPSITAITIMTNNSDFLKEVLSQLIWILYFSGKNGIYSEIGTGYRELNSVITFHLESNKVACCYSMMPLISNRTI